MKPHETRNYLDFYKTHLGHEILRRETGYVRAWLGDCERILDVGCGPGVFEKELQDMDITGIDASPEMIKLAGENSGNRFIIGRAEELPFSDSSFDGVFFITSLEFTQDYGKSLDEAARVLKEGGKILILMLNPESQYFREKLKKGSYIATNIKHTDLNAIKDYSSKKFDITVEYLLGIRGKEVFVSKDPRYASLYVIKGIKR